MPQNTTKIDVIDMPMGAGKTNGMIAYMNAHPENKYLFVTPYRTERKRIQEQRRKERGIKAPPRDSAAAEKRSIRLLFYNAADL